MEEISKWKKWKAEGWLEKRTKKGDTTAQDITQCIIWCDYVPMLYKPKALPHFHKETLAF